MNERTDELFGQALDEAVPETWTTLGAEQLDRLKSKFAELVRADEREACEEAVEEVSRKYRRQHYADAENIADECAAAIRASGEK